MITNAIQNAQAGQAASNTQNGARIAKFKADLNVERTNLARAAGIIRGVREAMAEAKKEHEEAQEIIRESRLKVQRLTNDLTNASDTHAAVQGNIARIQGQLAQLGVTA